MNRPFSSPSSRSSKWALPGIVPATMLVLAAFSIAGILEFSIGNPLHRHHLPIVVSAFLMMLYLALAVLAAEYFSNRSLLSGIRQAHDRLRDALVAGKSAVWESDARTRRDLWFGDLRTLFGVDSDEVSLQALDAYRYVHPEDRRRVSAAVEEAQSKRTPFDAEFRILREDEKVRWIRTTGRFYYTNKGDPERMLCVALDITDQRWAEEARIKSEEKFCKMFVLSPMAKALNSVRDDRYLDVNGAFEEVTGWSREELLGRTPFDISLWVEPSARHEFVKKLLADGNIHNAEFRFRRKDGEERVSLGSAELIEIEGQPCILSASIDITEKRKAEEALRESEEKFSKVFQSCPMAVNLIRIRDDRFLDVNEGFERLTGWSRAEVIGRSPLDFNLWIDLSEREKIVKQILTEGFAHDSEFRYRRKDGEQRIGLGSAELIDIKGEICLISAIIDITENRRAQEKLRESEKRFRRVVEQIQDAITVDDKAGQVVYANDRFLDLFGFRRDQLATLTLEDYVAPEYRAELRDRHDRRIRGEEVRSHFEYEGIRADGRRMWLEVDVVPIADEVGTIVGTQSAMRDITERHRAEEALRESEERFRLVANSAPVMIWMSGTDDLCYYFNKPWLDFTGRTIEEELGNGWAEGVHPEDSNLCKRAYNEAFERKQPFEVQYRMRRHDGEYRWLLDTGLPRFDADGIFAGFIGSCVDITERKLAEEAQATVGRRLIEAHEEERTRIARELHDDISQRLALLALELDQWDPHVPSRPEIREHVRHAQQSISEIARDVQGLSHRLHSSKLEYLGLAAAASSFCRELAEQNKVEVNFRYSGMPHKLPNEVSLCLFRVLQESLQNAVRHSGVRDFAAELKGTPGTIELTVTDAGIGFDEQEAFSRHGLGLISMRERVQLVHGDLRVNSKPGAGTSICARVPLKI